MTRSTILQLPTRANADVAWDEYCALARQYVDDDARKTDLEFCKRMARAYQRWSDLYLRLEAA
jgi:hypothetical protein